MIEGEKFKLIAYVIMLFLTFIDNVIHINQLLMVLIFTSLLVYIGCVNSAKVFKTAIENKDLDTMKQKDALLFPIIGGSVLVGLYLVFKYFDKDYINILFQIYFSFIGAYSIGCMFAEKLAESPTFKPYSDKVLFTIPKIPVINDKECPVNQLEMICLLPGSVFGIGYFFVKNWMLNNLFGAVFSIFGIENMLLGQYKVGCLLLVLLFFYDIFFVFYTPIMVGVAKKLQGPIKLMFPKVVGATEPTDFNLIGLGDIVIPGVFVALMLRFDIVRYIRKNGKVEKVPMNLKNFKYFFATLTGYVLGIVVTLAIMVLFNHAQPALLYLVPGCLLSSLLVAIVSGDFKEMWEFNEEHAQQEIVELTDKKKKE